MDEGKTGGAQPHEIFTLALDNRAGRETAALILYRAGYTVRERRFRSPGAGKATVVLDYWK